MSIPKTFRRRLLAARGALVALGLIVLLNGPSLFPCSRCDWDGHFGLMRVPGVPMLALCDRCSGKGYVTGFQWLAVAVGGRVSDGESVLVTTFMEPTPGFPSFREQLWAALIESRGNVRIHWPSPPALTLSTSGILMALQWAAFLVILTFAPLWECSCGGRLPGRRQSCSTCFRCDGSWTLSSFKRWVPDSWRSRLRRGGIVLLGGLPLLIAITLAAQIPYRPCPKCPEISRINQQNGDVIQGCPRCGDVGKICLWNSMFLSDE